MAFLIVSGRSFYFDNNKKEARKNIDYFNSYFVNNLLNNNGLCIYISINSLIFLI